MSKLVIFIWAEKSLVHPVKTGNIYPFGIKYGIWTHNNQVCHFF